VELIGGADIYITPYKHKGQVVSGTLAMLERGKSDISIHTCTRSSCWTTNAACLFPSTIHRRLRKNDRAIGQWHSAPCMRKRAYLYSRNMVWDRVAQQYMGSFERVYNERLRNPRATFSAQNTERFSTVFRL